MKTGQAGALVRIRDIGRVELGAQSYASSVRVNGAPGAMLVVNQAPRANALGTADAVTKELENLSQQFPRGLTYEPVYDSTQFVRDSRNVPVGNRGVAAAESQDAEGRLRWLL